MAIEDYLKENTFGSETSAQERHTNADLGMSLKLNLALINENP